MIASILLDRITEQVSEGEEERLRVITEGSEDADANMADAGESSDSEDAEAAGRQIWHPMGQGEAAQTSSADPQ